MVTRLRHWIRYRRALSRSVDAIEGDGYRISPGQYERMKAEARQAG